MKRKKSRLGCKKNLKPVPFFEKLIHLNFCKKEKAAHVTVNGFFYCSIYLKIYLSMATIGHRKEGKMIEEYLFWANQSFMKASRIQTEFYYRSINAVLE